jgi:hypothetical protein
MIKARQSDKINMRNRLFIIAFLLQLIQPIAFSQTDKFARPGNFSDINTLYTYQKSNWDGTHASLIYLYVKDTHQLESFKWNKGDEWSTLVSAELDWKTFSVSGLQNIRVFKNGEKKTIAWLKADEKGKLIFQVADNKDSVQLTDTHWHSYDFDFASLGFSWRALKNKESSFSFLIADAFFRENKIGFENKGHVQVDYYGREMVNGKSCLKYKIDGAGLQNKGGNIWINPTTFIIEQYKILLPDEEGFKDGMLQLLKTEKLKAGDWEKFKVEKMNRE